MSDQHDSELDNRDISPTVSEQFKVALGLDEEATVTEWEFIPQWVRQRLPSERVV